MKKSHPHPHIAGGTRPAPACACGDDATNQFEKIDGFSDTPMEAGGKWHVHDPARPQPQVVTPGAMFSQGAPAPSDAEVLSMVPASQMGK